MKKIKTVKTYITQLPQMGGLYFLVGLGCLAVLFKVTINDSPIYIPFAVIGIILGYYMVSYVDPGGRVDFWFFSSTKQTEEQKKLYQLVLIYKSKKLLMLTATVFIFLVSIISMSHHDTQNILKINNIIWLIFWTSLTMLMIGNGVKYLSAWWNIKRNWEKEFGEK